jgi:hypothetical protein
VNSKPSSKIISTLHQETIGGPIDDKSGNQNSCATVPLAGENACSDLHQCTMFVFPYLCVNTIYTLAPTVYIKVGGNGVFSVQQYCS